MTRKTIKTISLIVLSTLFTSLLGCTSKANPDPFEGYNRAIFKFNQGVDKVVYRPLAKTYDTVTPNVVQKGITNFYNNLYDITHLANDILQLNITWAVSDFWRLFFNTTLGVGGLFDVAGTHLNLPRHDQDFGITLARYGMRESPYFLLPFFAPGTFRDQVAFFVDYGYLSVYPYISPKWAQYSIYGLNLINQRAKLLPADKLVEEAFDPYIFVRDAYLQKRRQQIQLALNPNLTQDELEDQLSDESASVPLDDSLSLNNTKSTTGDVANKTASSDNDLNLDSTSNKTTKAKTKNKVVNKSTQANAKIKAVSAKTASNSEDKKAAVNTINTTSGNQSTDVNVIDATPQT